MMMKVASIVRHDFKSNLHALQDKHPLVTLIFKLLQLGNPNIIIFSHLKDVLDHIFNFLRNVTFKFFHFEFGVSEFSLSYLDVILSVGYFFIDVFETLVEHLEDLICLLQNFVVKLLNVPILR